MGINLEEVLGNLRKADPAQSLSKANNPIPDFKARSRARTLKHLSVAAVVAVVSIASVSTFVPNAKDTQIVVADGASSSTSIERSVSDSSSSTIDQSQPPKVVTTSAPEEASPIQLPTRGNASPDNSATKSLKVNKIGEGTVSVGTTSTQVLTDSVSKLAFPTNTKVELSAQPSSESLFLAWSGDCTGGELCNLTMDQSKEVTALFSPISIGGGFGSSRPMIPSVIFNLMNYKHHSVKPAISTNQVPGADETIRFERRYNDQLNSAGKYSILVGHPFGGCSPLNSTKTFGRQTFKCVKDANKLMTSKNSWALVVTNKATKKTTIFVSCADKGNKAFKASVKANGVTFKCKKINNMSVYAAPEVADSVTLPSRGVALPSRGSAITTTTSAPTLALPTLGAAPAATTSIPVPTTEAPGDGGGGGGGGGGDPVDPRQAQTITFTTFPLNQSWSSAEKLDLAATATSGLSVDFAVSDLTDACTITGGKIEMVKPGTCTIVATQSGSAAWFPATNSKSFKIGKADQTITFNQKLQDIVWSTTAIDLLGTSDSKLLVSFSSDSDVCTVDKDGKTLTLAKAGVCTITATQGGNTFYEPATDVPAAAFNISHADQKITFDDIDDMTWSEDTFDLKASTDALGLEVTFESTTEDVCSVDDKTVTLEKAGECTISASQSGDDRYNEADEITQSFTVKHAKGNPIVMLGTWDDVDYPATPGESGHLAIISRWGIDVALSVSGGYPEADLESVTFEIVHQNTGYACVLEDNMLAARHTGACEIVATLAENDRYESVSAETGIVFLPRPIQAKATGLTRFYDHEKECDIEFEFAISAIAGDSNSGYAPGDSNATQVFTSIPGKYPKPSDDKKCHAKHYDVTPDMFVVNPDYELVTSAEDFNGGWDLTPGVSGFVSSMSVTTARYGDRFDLLSQVSTSAVSEGAVTFSAVDISNNEQCTLTDGHILTVKHVGACAVTVQKAATPDYQASVATHTVVFGPRGLKAQAWGLLKKYDGSNTGVFGVTLEGLAEGDTNADAITGQPGTNSDGHAGSWKVTQGQVKTTDNYVFDSFSEGDWKIEKRSLVISAAAKAKKYGASNPPLTHVISGDGLVNGDILTGALAHNSNGHVGTWAISQGSLSATSDYDVTFNPASFTVAKRSLIVSAAAKSKKYGAATPAFTYTIAGDGLVEGDALTGSLNDNSNGHAGTWGVTIGSLVSSDDYDLAFESAPFTIIKRNLIVSAVAKSKKYGATDPELTYGVSGDGLVNGDTLLGSLAHTSTGHVGRWVIEIGSLHSTDDYTIENFIPSNFNVLPRHLTIAAINHSKKYGEVDPSLDYTVGGDGLVNGDVLTGALAHNSSGHVGRYKISIGDLDVSADYIVDSFYEGQFDVTPRGLEISAVAKSKKYGAFNTPLSYTVGGDGLVAGDALTGELATDSSGHVGRWAITQGTLSASSDYEITKFNQADYQVTPRSLIVSASAKSKKYGALNPSLTYSVSGDGLINGDILTGGLSHNSNGHAGIWAISQGSLSATSDYEMTFNSASFTVTKRSLIVSAAAKSKKYGAGDPELTYSVSGDGLVNGDALTGGMAHNSNGHAGIWEISQGSLASSDDYTMSFTGARFEVLQRNLTVSAAAKSKKYGAADPAFTYLISGDGLIDGDSAVVKMNSNSTGHVGRWNVQISEIQVSSDYVVNDISSADFVVTPRNLVVSAVAKAKKYGEDNPAFDYTVGGDGLVGTDALSGALAHTSNGHVGTWKIESGSLRASNDYDLSFNSADFEVTPRGLVITADAKLKKYGNLNPTLTYKVSGDGLISGDSLSGSLDTTSNGHVGKWSIGQGTLGSSNDYTISTFNSADYVVSPRSLFITAKNQIKRYGDQNPAFDYVISGDGLLASDTMSGSLGHNSNGHAGAWKIDQGDLAPSADYVVEAFTGADFTISKRDLVITAHAKSKKYGTNDPDFTYSIFGDGLAAGESLSGNLESNSSGHVGKSTISRGTLGASSDYNISRVETASFDVTPRHISVNAKVQSKKYGENDPDLAYTVGGDGLHGSDSLIGSLSTNSNGHVGKWNISMGSVAVRNSDYVIDDFMDADYSVTTRPITVVAQAKSKKYGDADPALTYTVGGDGLVGTETLSGALAHTSNGHAGTWAVKQGTVAASSDYAVTFTGADYTVNKRPITVVAQAKSKKYGEADPALTYTVGGDGLVGTETLSGALAHTSNGHAGTWAVKQGTVAASTDYTISSFTGADYTVNKRPITVVAQAKSKKYGEADPALTYTVGGDGLVGTDALSGALDHTSTGHVGTWAVNQGTLTNPDYAVTFTGADYTVNKRPITVVAQAKSKKYGDADPALTYTVGGDGLVGTDALSGALAHTSNGHAGTWAVNQGTLTNPDYAVTFTGASYTVDKRPITVVAQAKSKKYGDADPELTYTVGGDGLVGTDALSGALAHTSNGHAGTWAVNQGTVAASTDYTISSFTGASYTVNPRAVIITPIASQKKAKDLDPSLTYTLSGDTVISGDSIFGNIKRVAGEAVGKYKMDATSVIIRNGSSGNTQSSDYFITSSESDFEIQKRNITITATAATKVFGDANPALNYVVTGDPLASGDTLAGSLSFTGTDAGTYLIGIGTVGIAPTVDATNYNVTYVSANMVITQKTRTASVTTTSTSNFRVGNSGTASSSTNGDGAGTWSATGTCTVTSVGVITGTSAGSCTITVTYAATTNYTSASASSTFTVKP